MNGYTELNTFRYERKFIAEGYSGPASEAIVKQNSAFFVPAFVPRRVNNIYFDTPGLDCYFDNLFGHGDRWKVRLRWYDNQFGEINSPILEFKIKKGVVGTKKSYPLPSFLLDENFFEPNILKQLFPQAGLPPEVLAKLAGLQPVLFNSYFRNYFTTLNKNFRITIDTEMEYYNLRPTWNHLQHSYKEKLKTVIELKYNHEFDSEAGKISNQIPFRLDKNSKFVSGIGHFRNEIAL